MFKCSFSIFGAVALIAGIVLGSPVANSNEPRQDNFLPVTGALVGGTQPRIEIRTLKSQPEAWNLFLLAFARFQAMDQNARSSYFQIAAIHGQPYVTWDGVQPTGETDYGYCLHASNLFGPWHKPYLALFEQVLSLRAREIAAEFPAGAKREQYTREAAKLRIPYWDWALKSSNHDVLPDVITDATAKVTFPNGTTANIRNPLRGYDFHPLKPSQFTAPWDAHPSTVRSPSQPDDIVAVESRLTGQNGNIRTTLYQILTQYQSFNQFSNTGSEQGVYGSLEGIHNNIHRMFSGGHMGAVQVASFDPVFWLHHANVDRIMHIFMHIFPQTYVTPYAQSVPSWMAKRGVVYTKDTPLWPFHSTSPSSYWSSSSARPPTVLHYTYPELADNPSNATLKSRIAALYRPAVTSLVDPSSRAPPRAYLAVIDGPRSLPDSNFVVDVFLGVVAGAPPLWPALPGFVGSAAFSWLGPAAAGDVVRESVELTQVLAERFESGDLEGLDAGSVEAYLRANMKWRVQSKGVEIDAGRLRGLRVGVKSATVSEGEEGVPVFVEWEDVEL